MDFLSHKVSQYKREPETAVWVVRRGTHRQTGAFRLAIHVLEKMQVELHTAVDFFKKSFGDPGII